MKKGNYPQYAGDGKWECYNNETNEKLDWTVDSIMAFGEYANYSLYYSYNIGKEHSHQHDFYSVLKELYDFPESFILLESDLEFYTSRQLLFIDKLKNKCLLDGLKDICKNYSTPIGSKASDKQYNIEEIKKRNYIHLLNDLNDK